MWLVAEVRIYINMSIHSFFTRQIIVRRERDITGTEKRNLQATATVEGYYNDLDLRERNLLGILTERAWKFWFPLEEDIKGGDILEDENGKQYKVIEITKHDIGINEHLEVLTTEHNA